MSDFYIFRDLGACAAVCRNWVARSRCLQFKSLDVSTLDGLKRLLDLARAPRATLAPYVKRIEITFAANSLEYPDHDVIKHLPSLHALHALVVKDVDVPPIPAVVESMGTALGSLTNLVSLELIEIVLDSWIALQHIVGAIRRLERLYITDVQEGSEEEEEEEYPDASQNPATRVPRLTPPTHYAQLPASPCAALQLLRIVACDFSYDFLGWVRMPGSCHRLTCVCLDINEACYNGRMVGGILHDIGPALQNLCLEDWPFVSGSKGAPSFFKHFALHHALMM